MEQPAEPFDFLIVGAGSAGAPWHPAADALLEAHLRRRVLMIAEKTAATMRTGV